jgi:hypothetical protein
MDVKIFGGYNIFICIWGLVAIIVGILLSAAHFPDDTARCKVHPLDRKAIDDLNGFVTILGVMCVLGAIVQIAGGGTGVGSAFTKNKGCMICACILLTIACVVVAIAGAVAFMFGGAISNECDKRTCVGYYCAEKGCLSGGAGTSICRGWCKDHHDYFCDDLKGKSLAAGLIFIFGLIFLLPSCSCSCGAACCCPNSFGMGNEVGVYPGGVPQTVGQPVQGNVCQPPQAVPVQGNKVEVIGGVQ